MFFVTAVFELIPLPPSLGKRRGCSRGNLIKLFFIQESPPLLRREGAGGELLSIDKLT